MLIAESRAARWLLIVLLTGSATLLTGLMPLPCVLALGCLSVLMLV